MWLWAGACACASRYGNCRHRVREREKENGTPEQCAENDERAMAPSMAKSNFKIQLLNMILFTILCVMRHKNKIEYAKTNRRWDDKRKWKRRWVKEKGNERVASER